VTDILGRLALTNELIDRPGLSPEGLPERYLYSPDMVFRYAFGRWWGNVDLATTAIWVIPNPATGDTEQRHRPTLERCISRTRAAGHTGLVIANLFAFRDTNPRNLRTAPDAVGPANDDVLRVLTKEGSQTIAAWGGHGQLLGRSGRVALLLNSPMCLGVTQGGEPRHPHYIPVDTQLVPWVPVRPVSDAAGWPSNLFQPEPNTWGLRGDPLVWRAIAAQLETVEPPSRTGDVVELLRAAFLVVVGVDVGHEPTVEYVHRPEFASGGMSDGMIGLKAWRETLMPMLEERARTWMRR
jgi:hypothetical protein